MILAVVICGTLIGWRVYSAAAEATGNNNPLQLLSAFTPANLKQTNMQLNEMETLYSLIKDVNTSNIKTYSLQKVNGQQLLTNYTSYNGQSALIPFNDDFSQIESTLQSL